MTTTTIDLLRHGEAAGGSYYRGSTDDPLTALGLIQMDRAVAEPGNWTRVVSSPLIRCLDFAQTFGRQHKLPLLIEPRLKEIHFGDWEGKNADEIIRLWPQALERFYRNPAAHPPHNGEDFLAFRQRVQEAWNDIKTAQRGEHILIVTHAGVIRTLFSLLLNLKDQDCFHIQLNHGCLSRFQIFHHDSSEFVQLISHRQS
ncbi:MAG: histidine phosphatase family protein [Gammaproteobacteria bacterium]